MAGKKGQKRLITVYNKKTADKVLSCIESGMTLTKICKDVTPHLTPADIVAWKRTNNKFRDEYKIARESGLEVLSDIILDMTDEVINADKTMDKMDITASIAQRRLKVDIIKFLVAKGVTRLNETQKNGIAKSNQPSIVVQNYSTPGKIETNVTETLTLPQNNTKLKVIPKNWNEDK